MQTFIYKILPKKKRRYFEVNFNVLWYNFKVGKENLNIIENPKDE